MTSGEESKHLLTRFVFLDTEAYRKLQFDWSNRSFMKLSEFIHQGQIKLLTTDVTRSEVKAQFSNLLSTITDSLKKHEKTLEQLGAWDTLSSATDPNTALDSLMASYDKFLADNNAIEVPINAKLETIFDDYFARRPPFSEKKKSEFPDAVVVASLASWCEENRASAYVVSNDPDLKDCCSPSGPLYHAPSLADVISQATVSKEIHESLAESLREDAYLLEKVAEKIVGLPIKASWRPGAFLSSDIEGISGFVTRVDDVKIHYVNVYGHNDKEFLCEIEIEINLQADITIDVEARYVGYEEYEPSTSYNTSESTYAYLIGEVEVVFDPGKMEIVDIESIYVPEVEVELDASELELPFFR